MRLLCVCYANRHRREARLVTGLEREVVVLCVAWREVISSRFRVAPPNVLQQVAEQRDML